VKFVDDDDDDDVIHIQVNVTVCLKMRSLMQRMLPFSRIFEQ